MSDKAKASLKNILKLKPEILRQAEAHTLDPCLVGAIISRETLGLNMWGQPPNKGGVLGDGGFGHGPMQVDKRSFPEWCAEWRAGKHTLEDGISKGCSVLNEKLAEVVTMSRPGGPYEKLSEPDKLRAAISAYNTGARNVKAAVRKGLDVDIYTTGKDYSRDVLEQAEFFREHGLAVD